MLSKDGRDLLELGIEGVHYSKQGDKITYNEEERAKITLLRTDGLIRLRGVVSFGR